MGNSFGDVFRITTFGESHGAAIGVVIDGCPAGLAITAGEIQKDLDRRRPGQSGITSPRREADEVEILSGIFNGKTLGSPIALLLRNKDANPADYDHLKDTFRPSHADFTYEAKYGLRDHRGGGRASARETACRVAAGAIAKKLLQQENMKVTAFTLAIGDCVVEKPYREMELDMAENNPVRCPDEKYAALMEAAIEKAKKEGDTLGGIVQCVVQGCPAGLGEPVYDKVEAVLAKAMMGINATKGFEIGSGFTGTRMKGSKHNDLFVADNKNIYTKTNYSGGVQGGITNGMDIWFNVAFKPVSTLMQRQEGVNKKGEATQVEGKGRHDPCVVPRAVPVVEAMAAIVMAGFWLRNRMAKV